MSEEMKVTSNVMDTAPAPAEEQAALLEFTDQEILDYEEGTLTGKEKAKFLLLSPLPNAIIKFVFMGLGLVAAILWLVAALVPSFSEAMIGFYRGFTSMLAAINNIFPFSVMEIAVILTVLGWLAYLVYVLIRFIQVHKQGGKLLCARMWVQFGYATLAVVMFYTMLCSFGYGLASSRTSFHEATAENTGVALYTNTKSYEAELSETLLYFIDKLNTVVIEDGNAEQTIVYNANNGASKINVSGDRTAAISDYINEAFKVAAEEIPALKGAGVNTKELLSGPLYNSLNIGSVYSPITGEVLINPYFPEVAKPFLIAKAIAKQRGFQSDAQAEMIAFIVCTQYCDAPYVQYSAYFNAYLSCGNYLARQNPNTYATLAGALKSDVKKEVIYYTKKLDNIYGNTNSLTYTEYGTLTSSDSYLVYPELMTHYYREKMASLANPEETTYGYYVNSLIDLYRNDLSYQDQIQEVVAQYTEYINNEQTTEIDADQADYNGTLPGDSETVEDVEDNGETVEDDGEPTEE